MKEKKVSNHKNDCKYTKSNSHCATCLHYVCLSTKHYLVTNFSKKKKIHSFLYSFLCAFKMKTDCAVYTAYTLHSTHYVCVWARHEFNNDDDYDDEEVAKSLLFEMPTSNFAFFVFFLVLKHNFISFQLVFLPFFNK